MGTWDTPLDAYVPVGLSRADYDRTRRRFYEVTGAPRDDARLPKMIPPGAILLQSADRDPARDIAVRPETIQPTIATDVQTAFGARKEIAEKGVVERVAAAVNAPTDPVEAAVAKINGWGFVATPEAVEIVVGISSTTASSLAYNLRRWYGQELVPLPATPPPPPPAPPVAPDHSDDWWYDTPWGREVVVTFVPPLILGQYGWEPAEVTPIPTDQANLPPLVAMPWPHPYIVGGQEPLFTIELGTSSGMGDSGRFDRRTFGIFTSAVVVTGRGDRQSAKFYSRDDPFLRGLLPEGVPGVWLGHYFDEPSAEWWEQALEEVASTVARSSALSILTQVIGTYLTAGGATPLLQQALQMAAGQVQVTPTSGAAAPASGATVTSQTGASSIDLIPSGAQNASGPLEASGIVPSTPAATLDPVQIATQAPEITASVVAPEQTNVALATAAELSVYLDAMGSVQELWNMGFRELTIRAQRTKERADELRLRLAAKEAEVHGETWFVAMQAAVNAAMAIAGGVGGMSDLARGLTALARFGVSAGGMALRLQGAVEAARAMRERLEAEAEARRRALSDAIPTTTVTAPSPADASPVGASSAEAFWLWAAIGGAFGYAIAGGPGAAAGAFAGWVFRGPR